MVRRYLLLFVIGLSWFYVDAQDLHYSQFYNSPLNLSPALTGGFDGNQRFHGNVRNQWEKVPVDYLSFDLGADIKLQGCGQKNFLSLGALFNFDEVGDLDLRYTGIELMGAYSMVLGKGYLTPGIGIGVTQRRYDTTNAALGEQYQNGFFNPMIVPVDPLYNGSSQQSISFFDVKLGLNYRYNPAYRKSLDVGISLNNALSKNQSFADDPLEDVDLARKINIYGMFNWPLADKLDIILNALGSFQSPYREIVLNAQGRIYLNDEKTTSFNLGIGMRTTDAIYPMIAIEWNRWYAAFSYDVNTSDFDIATSNRGGPELTIRHIIAQVPCTSVKPCPIY